MKGSRIAAIAIVGIMIASGLLFLLPSSSQASSIHILSSPRSITVSSSTPYVIGGWETFTAAKVVDTAMPYPFYLRMVCKQNDTTFTLSTLDTGNSVQAYHENRWYVNATTNDYHAIVTFVPGWIDADGATTMTLYLNITTTDAAKFNTTSIALYNGVGSGVDQTWRAAVQAGTYYDYYGVSGGAAGLHQVRYADGSWLYIASTSYLGYLPVWAGSSFESSVVMGSSANINYGLDAGHLIATFKFETPNAYPTTAPLMLHLFPWTLGTTTRDATIINKTFDNPAIYANAAAKGYKMVLLHEQWFTWSVDHQPVGQQWMPYSQAVNNSLHNISTYCHQYGLSFGVYFGWVYGSDWGALTVYNTTAAAKAVDSWNKFNARWGSLVDFFYFDFAFSDFTGGSTGWAYHNVQMLNTIFESIKNTAHKAIVYNAGPFGAWWSDDQYLFPLKFESASTSNLNSYFKAEIAADPVTHNLNHACYIWQDDVFTGGAEVFDSYSISLMTTILSLAYQWGMTIDQPYHVANGTTYSLTAKAMENWTGGAARTGIISGFSTTSCVLESSYRVAVFAEDLQLSYVITPVINMIDNPGFVIRLTVWHSASTSNQSLILQIATASNIKVIDLATNALVSSTAQSDTLTWMATVSREYYIQATWPSTISPLLYLIPLFLTLGIVMIPISMVVKLSKEKRMIRVDEVVRMVLTIVVGLALVGITYLMI